MIGVVVFAKAGGRGVRHIASEAVRIDERVWLLSGSRSDLDRVCEAAERASPGCIASVFVEDRQCPFGISAAGIRAPALLKTRW